MVYALKERPVVSAEANERENEGFGRGRVRGVMQTRGRCIKSIRRLPTSSFFCLVPE